MARETRHAFRRPSPCNSRSNSRHRAATWVAMCLVPLVLAGCVVDGGTNFDATAEISNGCSIPIVVKTGNFPEASDTFPSEGEPIAPNTTQTIIGAFLQPVPARVYLWVAAADDKDYGAPHELRKSQFSISTGADGYEVYAIEILGDLCPAPT